MIHMIQMIQMTQNLTLHQPTRLSIGQLWVGRSRRVILLIAGIVLLSAADLAVTLVYARGGGMMEANPIALYLAKLTNSVWALAAYKTLTVTVCVALLFKLRKHAVSEAAAWCAVAILAGMSIMWHSYAAEVNDPDQQVLVRCDATSEHWLVLD
jgi:hypothetical protein